MARTYHLALVDGGNGRAIIEIANTLDQVSCECLKYLGERITTHVGMRRRYQSDPAGFIASLNRSCPRPGRPWTAVTFRRIGRDDYSAGHEDTYPAEVAEMEREAARDMVADNISADPGRGDIRLHEDYVNYE